MAKAKKKESTLTLEEKLAQALVLESEQPYKVPKNWCWVRLNETFENLTDSKKKLKQNEYLEEGEVCIVDQGKSKISGFTNRVDLKYSGALPVIIFGDHTRCIKYIDFPFVQGADGVKVLKPKSFYDARFFFFALTDLNIVDMGYRRHFPLFKQYNLPIPPISEQQRIVERIESLFAKLDEAKEKLQEVLDGFETRKAVILHKAFTGELTAKWREENGVSLDSWRYLAFKDIADIKSNLVEPSMYLELPHIAPDNIEKNTGKLLKYRTVFEDDLKSAKHHFFAGQILYSKIRPNLSKVVMVDFEGLCSADMYPIEAYEDSKYLWYYMLSNNFLVQACNAGSRSVLPKINQKELSKIEVVVPTILEQRHIVSILNEHMRKEDMLKIKAEEALEKIDGIKKAILARAFRGELGTNDENDECAVELLKNIL